MTQLSLISKQESFNKKIRPPIRYIGSKFNAAKYINPFLDLVRYNEYREPFLGCGAIFFTRPLVKYIWLNDIDKDLIVTFKVMADSKKRKLLKREVSKLKPSKTFFYNLVKKKYRNDIKKAYRYFVINRTAYGGIMNKPNWGFHKKKSVPPSKWSSMIDLAGRKLERVSKITSYDYKKVILAPAKGKEVLLFVDPPYFKADQKRAYFHSFIEKDHRELLKLLKNTSYKFCLTYDNCDELKEMYSWAKIHKVEWRYHTANSNKATRKIGKELIITNY